MKRLLPLAFAAATWWNATASFLFSDNMRGIVSGSTDHRTMQCSVMVAVVMLIAGVAAAIRNNPRGVFAPWIIGCNVGVVVGIGCVIGERWSPPMLMFLILACGPLLVLMEWAGRRRS